MFAEQFYERRIEGVASPLAQVPGRTPLDSTPEV
jgi:hypothetical protein